MSEKRLLLFLLILSIKTTVQCATYHDVQTWTNLTSVGTLCSKGATVNCLKLWLEGQARFGDDITRLSQSMARVGLGYQITQNTSLWFGYAWIDTGWPLTQNPFIEDRIWQQLLWIKPYKYARVTNRIRTEQRFAPHFAKTAYRIREMLKMIAPLPLHEKWSLVSSDEIFWHKNNFIGNEGQGFDQNRFFLGVGYNFTPTIITEIGYMNQYIHRIGVPNFQAHIASLNLYINWKRF